MKRISQMRVDSPKTTPLCIHTPSQLSPSPFSSVSALLNVLRIVLPSAQTSKLMTTMLAGVRRSNHTRSSTATSLVTSNCAIVTLAELVLVKQRPPASPPLRLRDLSLRLGAGGGVWGLATDAPCIAATTASCFVTVAPYAPLHRRHCGFVLCHCGVVLLDSGLAQGEEGEE